MKTRLAFVVAAASWALVGPCVAQTTTAATTPPAADAPIVEGTKVDASKVDASRSDASKSDASRAGASKTGGSTVVSAKPDAPKVDVVANDVTKADASKRDAGKPDTATVVVSPTPADARRFGSSACADERTARDETSSNAASASDDAMRWDTPLDAARSVDALAPRLEHVRIASPTDFIPSDGSFELLVFRTFVDRDATTRDGLQERLTWRALIVGDGSSDCATTAVRDGGLAQVFWPAGAWAERATRGTTAAPGTDFKADEAPQDKTLLHLDAHVGRLPWGLWRRARVYVIGSAGADGSEPRVIGSFGTVVANRTWAACLAILGCIVAYVVAAWTTYTVHRMRRVYDDDGNVAGSGAGPAAPAAAVGAAVVPAVAGPKLADRFKSSFQNQAARIDKGHGPLDGTNYKTIWTHIFNPVVLTASSNGLGNATNLQILFFSLIVFGLVTHIWLMTGHLTGLSETIVLLMGISGIGGTAAAGADLTKNRLTFENWTWLVNREWLPPGGIAEVNAAKWKDIFTTNGTFDVYHFQMVWFSVVVGVSLIAVGAQVNDLSTFEVPAALLGILGLSQVVYVAGKLVAPPSISDLDTQIGKLRDAEAELRRLNDAADATALAGPYVVAWSTDAALLQAYDRYYEMWQLTRTMFESTVGRLVPESATGKRPPFLLTDAILKRLPDAQANAPYQQVLTLAGTPAAPLPTANAPYAWRLMPPDAAHRYPAGMTIANQGNGVDAIVAIDAASAQPGDYRFAARIISPGPGPAAVREFALRIV